MKAIASVFVTSHILFKGSNTRQLTASKDLKLERLEDGVSASWVSEVDGKRLLNGIWVPDDNIVAITFVAEPVEKQETKR